MVMSQGLQLQCNKIGGTGDAFNRPLGLAKGKGHAKVRFEAQGQGTCLIKLIINVPQV
jgi:hypothetical protein